MSTHHSKFCLTVVLFLLCFLCLTSAQTSCVNNCSGAGTCLSTNVCACYVGYLGKDCSISGSNVYVSTIDALNGLKMMFEWTMTYNNATSTNTPTGIQMRWTIGILTWWGGIFNVDPDGMSPMGSNSGDTWVVQTDTTGAVTMVDYSSTGRNALDKDTNQDLVVVNSYYNATYQVVEFTRGLKTSDASDVVISPNPGTPLRFMWAYGKGGSVAGQATGSSSSNKRGKGLSMHGYLAETGQISMDFAGGVIKKLDDGKDWPYGYIGVLILTAAILAGPFFLLNRDVVKKSVIGRILRIRPLSQCLTSCQKEGSSEGCCTPGSNCVHKCTCDVAPSFVHFSIQEWVFFGVYILLCVMFVQFSRSDYDKIGRGSDYSYGHIAALHMALSLLPVTRNSIWLIFFNIGFDTAIKWHRRFGRMAILWTFIHLITMISLWDLSILFSKTKIEFGESVGWGTGSFIASIALLLSSLEFIRRKYYEVFLYSHIVFMLLANIFACLHSMTFRWLLLVPAVLYIVDVLIRTINPYLRYTSAQGLIPTGAASSSAGSQLVRVQTFGPNGTNVQLISLLVRMKCHEQASLPKPGSHFYIIMHELSLTQAHPFSITHSFKVKENNQWYIYHLFHIQPLATSSWTGQLLQSIDKLAHNHDNDMHKGSLHSVYFDGYNPQVESLIGLGAQGASAPKPATANANFVVRLDGPYNSITLPVLKYRVVVLVAGGIGVTPVMSYLNQILDQYEQNERNQTTSNSLPVSIHLIWANRGADGFQTWFPLYLERAGNRKNVQIYLYNTKATSVHPNHIDLELGQLNQPAQHGNHTVHVHQAGSSSQPSAAAPVAPAQIPSQLPESPRINNGRPSYLDLFTDIRKSLLTENVAHQEHVGTQVLSPNDVVVFSCGPKQMIAQAEQAAAKIGFHYTHEEFQW